MSIADRIPAAEGSMMDRTVSEMSPSTQRDAEQLARRYGFAPLAELAHELPEGADVLDVGAGASTLGREIALLRPDIRWTNVDYNYDDPLLRDELLADAPANLRFVTGDARNLNELIPDNTFDRVFSFWLLPHLSLSDDTEAIAAAKEMYRVTKDGGELRIGPVFSSPTTLDGRAETAFGNGRLTVKNRDLPADEFASQAVEQTRLSAGYRHFNRSLNQAVFEQFGTTRYARGQGREAQIYDPDTREYVSRYSRRGLQLTGQLIVAAAKLFVLPL